MPSVKPNEKKEDYISRCIAFVTDKEGLKGDAAAGKCYGLWRQYLKNKRAKGEELTEEEAEELRNISLKEINDISETLKKL